MKRKIILGLSVIIFGILFAFIILNNTTFYAKNEKYAFALQIGAFKNIDNANDLARKNGGIVILDNSLYKVYIGIYKNTDILNKMIVLFENKGLSVYLKSIVVGNKFYNEIDEYEKAITMANSEELIMNINKSILKRYEEDTL